MPRIKSKLLPWLVLALLAGLSLVGLLMLTPTPLESTRVRIDLFDPGSDNRRKQQVTHKEYFIYEAGQNSTFIVEPEGGCIDQVYVKSQKAEGFIIPPLRNICSEAVLDMSAHISPGPVQVTLIGKAGETNFRAKLAGPDRRSAALCGVLLACVAASAGLLMRQRWRLPYFACGAVAVAIVYYTFWLQMRPNLQYTNDLGGHISYVRAMLTNWWRPYVYMGGENFHPPLFYQLSVPGYALAKGSYLLNPLTALRLQGLLLYIVFLIYGVRALSEAVNVRGWSYRVGVMLVVFWPVGMLMATRINNDIALYAASGAAFYYIARWWRANMRADLHAALVAVGLALMIKSSAVVPLGIVGACIALKLLSRELPWRSCLQGRTLAAFGFAGFGVLFNLGKPVYLWAMGIKPTVAHLGGARNQPAGWEHFLSFDAYTYIMSPFRDKFNELGFASYFITTMSFGEYTFKLPMLASVINGLMLGVLFMTFFGTALLYMERPWVRRKLLPYVIGIVIPVAAMVVFMILKRWTVCQDFRFVLPMLVPIVILFVTSMQAAEKSMAGHALRVLYALTGLALPLAGVAFYLGQYLL